jgi:hypothetical protein
VLMSLAGGRGGNVTGVGGGAVSSSGQANYSRGGNRGRGFGHSARMQQHMAA